MPEAQLAPGIYIQEIPSGVRAIAAASTSITAFVGRTLFGPTNRPVLVGSYGEFTRTFGGLWTSAPMTYAVRDFFASGGSRALVVRAFAPPASPPGDGVAELTLAEIGSPPPGGPPVELEAASPGAWANERLTATLTRITGNPDIAARYGVEDGDLFNLFITWDSGRGPRTESIRNVTFVESSRRLDRVLSEESSLVRVSGTLPSDPGGDSYEGTATGGHDGEGLGTEGYGLEGEADRLGYYALESAQSGFNLLCLPPDTRGGDTPDAVYVDALAFCVRKRAVLVVDPKAAWTSETVIAGVEGMGLSGTNARNAAIYFPRVVQADPLLDGLTDTFVPCGIVAGLIAATDANRGVWKAPAGVDVALPGIRRLAQNITETANGALNSAGINCFRTFPVVNSVVWGARTMRGNDQLGDEYKYLPVRRLALYIEESLYRGTQWVVFEPNDEPLWSQIRLNVSSFMHQLFRQGAFQGKTPNEAYFVKCDAQTTTQDDVNLGVVNVLVGFAPLKPAEFVFIQIQQLAGTAAP